MINSKIGSFKMSQSDRTFPFIQRFDNQSLRTANTPFCPWGYDKNCVITMTLQNKFDEHEKDEETTPKNTFRIWA